MFITKHNPDTDSIEIWGDGNEEHLRDEISAMLTLALRLLSREEFFFILKKTLESEDSSDTLPALENQRYNTIKGKIKSLKS